jgi:4-carboxymuconolactone decarboxylase
MTERREKAFAILKNMLPPEVFDRVADDDPARHFAPDMSELALNGVFEPLWTDDGLDLRTRSLITVAILVALRAEDELAIHVPAAIRNGATLSDIEQVLYQATGYAGFPAANAARLVAVKALRAAGMLRTAD